MDPTHQEARIGRPGEGENVPADEGRVRNPSAAASEHACESGEEETKPREERDEEEEEESRPRAAEREWNNG